MWRSEPQTPVASTRTIASSRSISSGSGRSSSATSPGAWKVTACMGGPARYSLAARDRRVLRGCDGDARVVPSELTRGPWDPNAQHAGPPSALLARALERCEPREGARIGRITVEILGAGAARAAHRRAPAWRGPGRSVELLEASLGGPGRRGDARARLAPGRGGHHGRLGAGRAAAGPRGRARPLEFFPTGEEVGYHTAMEIVFARGRFLEPGPGHGLDAPAGAARGGRADLAAPAHDARRRRRRTA